MALFKIKNENKHKNHRSNPIKNKQKIGKTKTCLARSHSVRKTSVIESWKSGCETFGSWR